MKIDKAIKDLQARVDGEFSIKGKDDCEDMKLGIEALKRVKGARLDPYTRQQQLLPGETPEVRVPSARIKVGQCTAENPCCDRRGEYNGLGSGPLKFECPKHCSCHD